MNPRIGFLISHPIQYYTPIFRELAGLCDLTVYFAHRQTAEEQAREGFGVAFEWNVDLLSGYRSKFLENVSTRPGTDHFGGRDTPGVAREIAEGGFDAFVVPGWGLRSYLQAANACRRACVPVFVRGDSQLLARRGFLIQMAKAVVFSRVLRRFDGFLYVGQRNREYLRHYGVRDERLFFSPHCVDNDAFGAASDAARASGVQRSPGAKRILFVGKLVERKRPVDVLRAAALVRARGRAVEVAFAGSGALEDELRREAAATGVPTVFHGFVNQREMPAIYAAADVLVLPSDGTETWGLAVNEGMACGLPAVVSDAVGCGPDMIEQGRTGAVFAFGDAESFARAVETAISLDAGMVQRHIAARMAVYSPRRAAQGILEAAAKIGEKPRQG
ncbi:MAG: glycosyltransferase family 4 protein [Proteobacteria bacterium]|nr:glycosyltransferase family 4 protein [Pseudomonadota bacterium]